MLRNILRIYYAVNIFVNVVLIFYRYSQSFRLRHVSECALSILVKSIPL
jgi:hypothetical protein